MSTSQDFADYIVDQASFASGISVRAMFGEYALYSEGVVVGLICDNTCYLKITPKTTALLGDKHPKAPAYPGAKLSYVIDEDILEDREKFAELIGASRVDVLATQKPKKPKRKD